MDDTRWRRFYELEADSYQRSRYGGTYGRLFRQLHHEVVAALLRPFSPGRILEVAAGTGHTSLLLAEMGFDVIAVDLTGAMLVHARDQLAAKGLAAKFSLANAFRLPFADGRFPLVASTRFLHLWPEREQRALWTEMARVLQPGGRLLVDFNNWWHRALLAGPISLYQRWRGQPRTEEHYNRVRTTMAAMESVGLRVERVCGVGGYHLVAAATLGHEMGVILGRWHRSPPLRLLAEQFVMLARKS